jgi:translation initiation factor 2-alpha kinase 1
MADQHVVTTTATTIKNANADTSVALSDAVVSTSGHSNDEIARERETLLLMLLGQVCSLHDATPRTFVVHVIALYERGILESSSIQLLVDIGLIPRPTARSKQGVSSPSLLAEIYDYDSNSSDNDTQFHNARQGGGNVKQCSRDNVSSLLTASINDESAIVPYHDSNNNSVRSPRSELLHRQQEALAIREHLEQMHESESLPSNTVSTSNDNGWNRANTQSTLTSVDESFNNPSLEQQYIPPSSDEGVPPTPLSTTQPSSSTSSSSSSTSWSVEHHPLSLSRYQREFIQISLLATGSFGSVYHAIHKLEYPQTYAIKCVTFTTCGYYATALSLVMREVRILAKLDHPNCVRFYTSWLEPSWMTGGTSDANNNNIMIEEEDEDDDDDEEEGCFNDIVNPIYPLLMNRQHTSSGSNSSSNPKLLTDIDRVLDGLHKSKEIDESVSQLEAILYGDKFDDDNDDGFDWTMDSPRNERSVLSLLPLSHRYSRGTSGDDDSEVGSEWTQNDDDDGERNNSFHNSKVYARQRSLENRYLMSPTTNSSSYRYQISMYIQMQLCNPRTLAEWISDRNNDSNNCIYKYDEEWARSAIEIFKQIVSGLTHVHSKGIIHRDLKPANIFSGDDGTFMIGDFGLSKMISDANTNEHLHTTTTTNVIVQQQHNSNGHHTVGVGTASYASPEQITSKTYGPASDIYSLGLILLELIGNFTSEHERAKAFHDCRYKREVMPWLCQEYPEISLLILSCTETDPTRRPLASDILTAELLTNDGTRGGHMVQNLKTELSLLKMDILRKDNIIESQAQQLKEKDNIIENLNRRLANLESRIVVNENEDIPPSPQDPTNYQP